MQVEHRKIRVMQVEVVDRRAGALAECGVISVGAAQHTVPDAGIVLGVAGQRVLLPLIPGHGGIVPRQRPDQRLIERRPDAAADRGPRLPWATLGSVRPLIHLHGADGRWAAQQFVHGAHQLVALLGRGHSREQRPGLRLQPQRAFSHPSQRGTEPGASQPFTSPLLGRRGTVRVRAFACARRQVSVAGIGEQARI